MPAAPPTGNVEVLPVTPPARAASVPPAPTYPIAPAPVVAPPQPQPVAASELEPNAGVRLGFADGSDLHLDPDDPHTLALKAVADVLVHGGQHRRKRH